MHWLFFSILIPNMSGCVFNSTLSNVIAYLIHVQKNKTSYTWFKIWVDLQHNAHKTFNMFQINLIFFIAPQQKLPEGAFTAWCIECFVRKTKQKPYMSGFDPNTSAKWKNNSEAELLLYSSENSAVFKTYYKPITSRLWPFCKQIFQTNFSSVLCNSWVFFWYFF